MVLAVIFTLFCANRARTPSIPYVSPRGTQPFGMLSITCFVRNPFRKGRYSSNVHNSCAVTKYIHLWLHYSFPCGVWCAAYIRRYYGDVCLKEFVSVE